MRELKSFIKIFNLFDKRQKVNGIILLVLTVFGAIAETFSIGVILPFMYVILNPETIQKYDILKMILNLPAVGTYTRFVVLMCLALALVFILKSLYMFFLIYIQNRLSYNRQVSISKLLFSAYIQKPYAFFFNHNSAELQRNINVLVPSAISGVFLSGLTLITEGLIILFIVIFLFLVSTESAAIIVFALGGICFTFYLRLKRVVDRKAKEENKYGNIMVKAVNESMASIKEIKILGRAENFVNAYEKSSTHYAQAKSMNSLLMQTPRLLIEAVTVLGVIAIVVVNILAGKDVGAIIPTLAIFGMSAFRVMPSMNRVLSNMTTIRYNAVHLDAIYDDLLKEKNARDQHQEKRKDGKKSEIMPTVNYAKSEPPSFKFQDSIELKNITYRYPEAEEDVLSKVHLTIKKGSSIGVIGPSGAGKTTLIDLILGLLPPTAGELLLDGINADKIMTQWHKTIGYVPQHIFLIDDSIAKNVAFGIPEEEIDLKMLWHALEIAQMKDFVESQPDGFDTKVGETGIKLSGGQRQRLGIARAVYHNPEVLVFDEATSSLDSEIEKTISDAVSAIGKTKTMIIIAHRINTLSACDEIYEVRGKSVSLKEKRGIV